jgi:alkylation response protein AidB-like acyl-CoA dehydrogenase
MYDYMLNDQARAAKARTREFIRTKVDRQLLVDMDADRIQYPREFVRDLAAAGLLGLRFPAEYGGGGLDWVAEMAALTEIGTVSMALGCLASLPSICGEALNVFGTEAQKLKYLKPILAGEKFCAEALTEPRGGSDFFGATTTAVRDGDTYVLNGQKRFVVGAEGADVFLVYARTSTDPSVPSHKAISLFIVERDMGVTTDYLYGLMGTRGGGAGRIVFNDVRVPAENLVLGEGEGGKIFYQMMYPERMTSSAGPIGMAAHCLDIAVKYSTRRKAFGQAIQTFQGVSFRLADSIMLLDACRAMLYATARALDQGIPAGTCRRLVSETKRFCTENCHKVIDHAMQVLGGIGYTNVFPIEKFFRDIRLSTIWTGTSEVMNLIIQHEYFREVLGNASELAGARDVEADAAEAGAEGEKIYE